MQARLNRKRIETRGAESLRTWRAIWTSRSARRVMHANSRSGPEGRIALDWEAISGF